MKILIIAHNQREQLELCLNAIRLWGAGDDLHEPLGVLVVDNASEDGTAAWLALQEDVAYAVTERKQSYASLLNEALEELGAEDILIWNPCYALLPGCLSRTKHLLESDEHIGVAGVVPFPLPETGKEVLESYERAVEAASLLKSEKAEFSGELPEPRLIMVRKGLFEEAGKLCEGCRTDRSTLEEWLNRVRDFGYHPGKCKNVYAYPFFMDEETDDGAKGNVLLLTGGNPIIQYTCRELGQAFRRCGYRVFEFDMKGLPEKTEELQSILRGGLVCAFALNNLGWFVNQGEKNVWEYYGISCINFLFDHPVYSFQALEKAPANGVVTCVDRKHVEYVHKYYPKVSSCIYMPLGGQKLQCRSDWKPWRDREIDVLYLGGYQDLSELPLTRFQKLIAERMKLETEKTVDEIIEELGAEADAGITWEQKRILIEENCNADWYMKIWMRREAVGALLKGGIRVDVCGGGWENVDYYSHSGFCSHGYMSQAECLSLIRNSKIVLNVMPNFRDAVHDRVINAMLGGAVALTDDTKYLAESFERGRDYIAYSRNRLEQLPELVNSILLHPGEAEAITERAYRKAVQNHTWDARVEELMRGWRQA